MKKNHIASTQVSYKDFKIDDISHKIFSVVALDLDITYSFEHKTILDCSIDFQIDNSDLIGIENTFDLYLIGSEQISQEEIERKSFKYKVKGTNDQGTFRQVLELPKGSHKFNLFSRVDQGSLKFSKVQVRCFAFIEYPHIEEYVKGE